MQRGTFTLAFPYMRFSSRARQVSHALLGLKMQPKRLKTAQGRPRKPPRRYKRPPRMLQDGQRGAQDSPKEDPKWIPQRQELSHHTGTIPAPYLHRTTPFKGYCWWCFSECFPRPYLDEGGGRTCSVPGPYMDRTWTVPGTYLDHTWTALGQDLHRTCAVPAAHLVFLEVFS